MRKVKQEAKFELPSEFSSPIKWSGPIPLVIEKMIVETDAAFEKRKAEHDAAVALARRNASIEATQRFLLLAEYFEVDLKAEDGFRVLSLKLTTALFPECFTVDYGATNLCPAAHHRFHGREDVFGEMTTDGMTFSQLAQRWQCRFTEFAANF